MTRTVRRVFLIAALALLVASCAFAAPADPRVVHVLNRLSYGPRPGDVERVTAIGVPAWIDEQLHPERLSDADVEARLKPFPSLAMNGLQIFAHYPVKAMAARIEQMAAQGNERARQIAAMMPPQEERGNPRDVLLELTNQKLIRAVHSPRQLQEVMVDFWLNHFNVYWLKGADRVLLTEYERDTLRPHALGRFRDLLGVTATSPAMLFYLDNWLSTASTAKAQGKRKPGLNENYARELMELHTLGVDGGYTQRDVVEVARCFTGWTLDEPQRGARFVFRPKMHDDGQKVVLGRVIPAGGGENDGRLVLDILCRDPHTALFISRKLCRRFVSDQPSEALVKRVARVFRKSDGDLRRVLLAIFESKEFNAPAARRAKIKTPFELVVSAIRAVDGETSGGLPLGLALQRMGMPLYLCQPPTGYADRAEAWVSSGALLERLSFAVGLMEGRMTGTAVHPERLPRALEPLLEGLLGAPASAPTRQALEKALRDPKLQGEGRERQLVGLILGSPEFQRR